MSEGVLGLIVSGGETSPLQGLGIARTRALTPFAARDARLVEQVGAHHTGLLSRLLTLVDEAPQGRVRLLSLAKVDRILDRRGDLENALLQLRNRSWRDGRRIQLERELRRNARDLRAAVRELIADVQLLAARRVAVQ